MTPSRLMFLHPRLLRAARLGCSPQPYRAPVLARYNGTFAQRRGKAVEPMPDQLKSFNAPAGANGEPQAAQDATTPCDTTPAAEETQASEAIPLFQPKTESSKATEQDSETTQQERARLTREEAKHSGPLEAILHMQPPEQVGGQRPPISPLPYVHHFDTYSLVKQLQDGGYSQAQATTAMKAIRTSLAHNLDVAQNSLVSKSDVENETYLFTAACSELSTEIKNNRRLQDEQLRQQRTHLQHEVDILQQSLNQEASTLNDTVRGMFNDRKMAVSEEQKVVESAIQKINYKISIQLSSDAKSEIEAVRWILIRRSVLGILFMAVLTLGTLRYATYVSHEREKEADRKRKEEEEEKQRNGGKREHSSAADAAVILTAN